MILLIVLIIVLLYIVIGVFTSSIIEETNIFRYDHDMEIIASVLWPVSAIMFVGYWLILWPCYHWIIKPTKKLADKFTKNRMK